MEPERKIEKLLRAYAQKRRAEAGDPLTLHPANRRILQGEATRHAPKPDEGSRGGLFLLFLALFRRRLMFGLPVIVIAFLAFMYLPALNSAKRKAQSIGAMNNLKEIGVATRRFAEDNKDVLPASLDEVTNELGTSKVLIDPVSGKPFVYAGGGKKLDELQSNTLLAYSGAEEKDHAVLFADGRVETVTGARLADLTNQKPVEFVLADKAGRERSAEIPATAAPAVTATPVVAPPGLDVAKLAQSKEQLNTTGSGVQARSAGELARWQPEIAKSEPVATPTPIGATSLGEIESTSSLSGSISAKLPATENSDALAQNRSFDRLITPTNADQPAVAAESQNFIQTGTISSQNLFRNGVVSAQNVPVLQSFQLQQNGSAIAVVDRDGSVYNGSVQPEKPIDRNQRVPVETPPGAVALRQARAAPPAGNQQQPIQNYFFRVAGMNRTLQQNVVFTGNVEAATNAITDFKGGYNFGGVGGGGGGGVPAQNNQQVSANQSAQQNFLSNSRIVGTAVIASTNQIEINAVPITQ